MRKLPFIATIFLSGTLFISCGDDEKEDEIKPEVDYSGILKNTGENVILQTYEELSNKTQALLISTQTLENNQTAANLKDAKAAWVAARSPWEQAEGFLFGPVEQEGLDPSLDSWPVNVIDLNNVLSSNNELTVDFLAQQEGTLKGFHTIEYLLWGENGNKQVGGFTAREFEYLAATSGALAADAKQLYDLWKPSSGNYINNILNAGNGSVVYVSQKSALEEMANALVIIADEVGNGKINDPFVQKDLTLEESRFSANSKADFANNMRSIKNIYTGKFGSFGDGKSISQIIDSKDSNLNNMVIKQIDDAINAIENIPGTFSDAVVNNSNSVSASQIAVRELQTTLEEKVLPLISNL